MITLEDRVALGIKLLDIVQPDWRDLIDRDRLNLGNDFDCLGGQLEGSYEEALTKWGLDYEGGAEHGFDVLAPFSEASDQEWEFYALQVEWQRVLSQPHDEEWEFYALRQRVLSQPHVSTQHRTPVLV